MFQTGADWLARRESLPTALRAVLGYYGTTGVFDYDSLGLKRRTDERVEAMIADAFADIETAIAAEFGYDYVDFEYETKLVMPAKLTLGYLYRRLDEQDQEKAEEMTRLAVEALLDGDMRDALNDAEFEDFGVDFEADEQDREAIAEIAQDVLQARVEDLFAEFSPEVREHYEWAVDISERHQQEDPHFRSLMADAKQGDGDALDAIRSEYKFADFDEDPEVFTDEELGLPYLKTQYDRVGVIYDAMIRMYRSGGLPVEDAFHRSIVLAIIGAQVWLDDLDDYEADMADGQLTPVTAEYLLEDDDRRAKAAVVETSEQYLDRAITLATTADSPLTGIATEYIRLDGTPNVLPE